MNGRDVCWCGDFWSSVLMVGMPARVRTSGVVCVNGRDVCSCGDFWSSVCE